MLLVADKSYVQRLHIDQVVTLNLDEVPESIQCRVLDVQGSVTRLAYRDELPPRAIGRLVLGSAGYLVFDEFRLAVGLRVAVRASPPYLDVAVMDGVTVPERRAGERVKLVTRARIMCPDEHDGERPAEWTYTIDLSEGGALLRDHPALNGQQRLALELMFGDDPRPVSAQVEVVRRVQDAVGVAFESMPADDATRLAGYLMGMRHRRRAAPPN
ncbi:MAG: PilZ domain-containing protein [Solirubrobacteraceae bacterium]